MHLRELRHVGLAFVVTAALSLSVAAAQFVTIGKRINIGDPGLGQHGTLEVGLRQIDWAMGAFAWVSELKPSEQSGVLYDNKIDTIVFTVGHPNSSVQDATT